MEPSMEPPMRALRDLGVVVLVCAAALGCRGKTDPKADTTVTRIHVDTVDVRSQPMPRTLALTGNLRGKRQTDLAANTNGRVLETFVERGTEVKKGDMLAKVDVRSAALTAAEARANAALARSQRDTSRRECDRYKTLLAQGAIGQAEFDRVADQCRNSPLSVEAAEARASAAAQVVGDGQIRAPFGGIITERWVEAGQYVRSDARVVSLVAIDTLRLELTIPEAHMAAVKQGGALTFTVPAYPGRRFPGTVRFISAAVREATRDLVVEAEVENPDRALRPGMFAAIDLAAGEAPMLVVPKESVVTKEGSSRVFAVVDRRVEERVVQPGPTKDGVVAIARGLKEGEHVVKKPDATLQNGQAVE